MKSLTQYIIESATAVNGFCILKPGFLEHEEDWLNMLKNNGWNVIQKRTLRLTQETAAELYKPHEKKKFYNDLVNYMASDDCLCCMCYKNCEDPIKDMDKLKDKVRKAWGIDDMKNVMHSSDSLDNVERERKIVFN